MERPPEEEVVISTSVPWPCSSLAMTHEAPRELEVSEIRSGFFACSVGAEPWQGEVIIHPSHHGGCDWVLHSLIRRASAPDSGIHSTGVRHGLRILP